MEQSVYAVATMDTKGHELAFVAERLRAAGVAVVTVDVGTKEPPCVRADIDRSTVAGCHPAAIGEIVVAGPVVTQEYFNSPEANRLAKIADPARRAFYHRMGDVGYRDNQGRLWFCGRKLLERGAAFPHTWRIKTILFHPSFPVDIRHNAKIFREKLAVWDSRRLS